MRTPFIAGNWKMHLNRAEAARLAGQIAEQLAGVTGVEVAVCPPSVYLEIVQRTLGEHSPVGLGAQNMHYESQGAFTGEVSAEMLVDLGCKYVILGHSERRHGLGEPDELIHRKVLAALAAGLVPIVCVGETLEERETDRTRSVVQTQCDGSLAGLSDEQMRRVVIAYEPVWAIGTGKVATPEQAEAVHADLRSLLQSRYNASVAEAVRIQYGGSVKPENAGQLLSKPNIDGALVGGASLQADSFLGIVTAAANK